MVYSILAISIVFSAAAVVVHLRRRAKSKYIAPAPSMEKDLLSFANTLKLHPLRNSSNI